MCNRKTDFDHYTCKASKICQKRSHPWPSSCQFVPQRQRPHFTHGTSAATAAPWTPSSTISVNSCGCNTAVEQTHNTAITAITAINTTCSEFSPWQLLSSGDYSATFIGPLAFQNPTNLSVMQSVCRWRRQGLCWCVLPQQITIDSNCCVDERFMDAVLSSVEWLFFPKQPTLLFTVVTTITICIGDEGNERNSFCYAG